MREYASLGDFLDYLRHRKSEGIAVVDRQVNPVHELGTLVKKLEKRDHRVVLFNDVEGHQIPVVMNVFGTTARTALALGLDPDTAPSTTLQEFAHRLNGHGSTRSTEGGPVQQVVIRDTDVDLDVLPISVHAALQAGKYINSGIFVVRDPISGALNGGIYRLMVQDRNTLTVSVDPGHDLGRVIQWGRDNAATVPFACIVGADPTVYLASQAKVPISRDLYEVTAALAQSTVDVTKCISNDILVPTAAEIVIEGHISPGETAPEGPYGEFSYYYGSDPHATVCHIDAITRRTDAVYMDIHPVHTEHRNLWLHPGRELGLLAKLQSQVPDVASVHLPLDAAGMACVISIRKRHGGDPKRALLIALASDVFIKHAIVVDDDIDIADPTRVVWALTTQFQADRDLIVVKDVPGYVEDPSSYPSGEGSLGTLTSKVGFDATRSLGPSDAAPADVLPPQYADLEVADYVTNPRE